MVVAACAPPADPPAANAAVGTESPIGSVSPVHGALPSQTALQAASSATASNADKFVVVHASVA